VLDRTGHGTSSDLNIRGDITASVIPPALNLDALNVDQKRTLLELLELAGITGGTNGATSSDTSSESSKRMDLILASTPASKPRDVHPTSTPPATTPALSGDTIDTWADKQLPSHDPLVIDVSKDDYATI
jgi:hypothetical protein